jgi:hypothetical protein
VDLSVDYQFALHSEVLKAYQNLQFHR